MRGETRRISSRANREESWPGNDIRRNLRQREIEHCRGVGEHAAVLRVFHYTYDFHKRWSTRTEALAHRVSVREQAAAHRLIDNRDLDGILLILRAKVASLQQRHSKCGEESWLHEKDDIIITLHAGSLPRRRALD